MDLLKGKTVFVTGSNRGIGKALLESCAKEGASLIAHARKSSLEFDTFLQDLRDRYSIEIETCYFDLIDESSIKQNLKEVLSKIPTIDVLINNAGIAYGSSFHMTSLPKLRETFEINFFSQVLITQIVSRKMIKQGSGSIINMVSVGGIETNPGYLAYGSSKAAFIWETKALSKEVGVYGIRVNGIAPGLINTSMGHYKNEIELKKVIERTSLQKMGDIDDISNIAIYLASDLSKFVTGQIISVDGGR